MTDREKLLTALLGESDRPVAGRITELDVFAMLRELGDEHRRGARRADYTPSSKMSMSVSPT